jgi:hypothetical protein
VSTHLEDLLREAQQRVADRAPDPDRIRAGLPARARRMTQRRRRTGALVAVAAAVAVAGALTVPALVLRRDTSVPVQPAAPNPGTSSAPAVTTGVAPVSLRYRPTWLPAGVGERSRMASLVPMPDGYLNGVDRTWTRSALGPTLETKHPSVSLGFRYAKNADEPLANQGTVVTISGKKGYYHGEGGDTKSYVEWRIDANLVASVFQSGMALSKQQLVQIAESVQPDPGALAVPLRLGWLPDDLDAQFVAATGNGPTAWNFRVSGEKQREFTGKDLKEANRSVSVEYGTLTSAPDGGDNITVGGRRGRYVERTIDGKVAVAFVVVEAGQGRFITVIANDVTRDDMIKVAANVEVTGEPDLAWLGRGAGA